MRLILFVILTIFSIESFSQFTQVSSPVIEFRGLEVKIDEVNILIEGENSTLIFTDTANIILAGGATIQGQFIQIVSSSLKDIKVEQQYETSFSVIRERIPLALPGWKHHTSDWVQLEPVNDNKFKTHRYSMEEQERFPEFSKQELQDYLISTGMLQYPDLISIPDCLKKETTGYVGLSRISLRFTGIDKDNKIITRIINFDVSIGC